MVDISIVLVTYNPDYCKLIKTINSILNQRDVSYEIIIADDGSKINYFDDIDTYFRKIKFTHYILVPNVNNQGTCLNLLSGMKMSTGFFVKTISPGDYLFDKYTLKQWVDFMRQNNYLISFGNEIDYHMDGEEIFIDQKIRRPLLIEPFKKEKINEQKLLYLLLGDTPVGANFIENRDFFFNYLEKICGKVKYAEDFAMKLMVMDGVNIEFYDEHVIWYENGTGISTNSKWKGLLDTDRLEFNNLVKSFDRKDGFINKYIKYVNASEKYKTKWLKYFFFPGAFLLNIRRKLCREKTRADFSFEQMISITEIEGD